MRLFLLSLVIARAAQGQTVISPEQFYEGIQSNAYDAIIDVRTLDEWNDGHIANATLVESSQLQASIPDDILGCKGWCRMIVVYCRSGARAGVAIDLLLDSGFNGTLYNGQGVSQWTAAGYSLVSIESEVASCASMDAVQSVTSCDPEPPAPSSMPSSHQPISLPTSSSAEQTIPFKTMHFLWSIFVITFGSHKGG